MKKQVTFVEHLKSESRVKRGNAHVLMRSAESTRRHKDVLQQPAPQRMCAARPLSWTQGPPLQRSKCVQHRAHEAADEETLPQRAARVHPVRCVCTSLEHKPHHCSSRLWFLSFRSE
ncbi:hypothetical protein FQA47_000186 [Oryzias melastigma]|uniref:Uncharacterized protein n=1 Tax=Oryzias melastigma TaxID=30732 RepID=A0A834F3W8_ORYME|nr:hypothetical protein FQA47_000186 [Oryzias melastigma]